MVIKLQPKVERSSVHQEKSIIQAPILISQTPITEQEEVSGLDITVEDDNEDYLPILGGKIKKFFDDRNKQRIEDYKNGIIHIGNITSGCMRQSVIQQEYADKIENNIYDYCNFMDGLDSEKIIVDILNHSSNKDGDFQKDLVFDNFVGHPDYIDISQESGKEVIFELKST